MNTTDLAIILASLVVVVTVGLWASRRQGRSARDYFLASRQLPWWIIGAAFVSTSVSSEQIVGTVGIAYETGMGVTNWEWFILPQYTLLMLFFIPLYLKNRITTVPELLARRYGPFCGNIYSWATLVAYVFIFLVPVLYGGSLVLSQLTGFGFSVVLWVTVALVALYTAKGGLKAVVWTDAVQCVMLVGGGLVLFFVALSQIEGGWSAMVEANPDRFHLYRSAGDETAPFLGMIAASFGVFLWYQGCNAFHHGHPVRFLLEAGQLRGRRLRPHRRAGDSGPGGGEPAPVRHRTALALQWLHRPGADLHRIRDRRAEHSASRPGFSEDIYLVAAAAGAVR